MKEKKTNNWWNLSKVLLGLLFIALVANRLYHAYNQETAASVKYIFSSQNVWLVFFSFSLMFVNWALESYKWKFFTAEIERISFGKSWQSVWMGVCVGNLTPARIGEFAGRILFFQPKNRAKATSCNFINSIAQTSVNIVIGCFGLLLFSSAIYKNYFTLIISLEILLLILFIFLLLRINNVLKWISGLSFARNFRLEELEFSAPLILKLLFFSLIRYMVYFFQFYLLLLACHVYAGFMEISAAIAIMYLLISTIPMISGIDIAVRAFIVTLLFGGMQANEWQLSIASTLLWLINIVVPSIAGYYFIVKNKFSFGSRAVV